MAEVRVHDNSGRLEAQTRGVTAQRPEKQIRYREGTPQVSERKPFPFKNIDIVYSSKVEIIYPTSKMTLRLLPIKQLQPISILPIFSRFAQISPWGFGVLGFWGFFGFF